MNSPGCHGKHQTMKSSSQICIFSIRSNYNNQQNHENRYVHTILEQLSLIWLARNIFHNTSHSTIQEIKIPKKYCKGQSLQ